MSHHTILEFIGFYMVMLWSFRFGAWIGMRINHRLKYGRWSR